MLSRLRPLAFLIKVVLIGLFNNAISKLSSVKPALSWTTYRLTQGCHVGSPQLQHSYEYDYGAQKFMQIPYKNSVLTSQRAHSISITKINLITVPLLKKKTPCLPLESWKNGLQYGG